MDRIGIANALVSILVATVGSYLFFGPGAVLVVVVGAVGTGTYLAMRSDGGPRRGHLAVAAVVNAAGLFVLNAMLALAFGIVGCGGDGGTSYSDPGSDRDAYCSFFGHHGAMWLLTILGPPLLALIIGVMGARMSDRRRVLVAAVAGLVLTIVLHLPEWVLSGAA
jgi:lysylphosphatidylglycerol synthetase-like protein (DUF2156 family)